VIERLNRRLVVEEADAFVERALEGLAAEISPIPPRAC
jgi:hypothetical protein